MKYYNYDWKNSKPSDFYFCVTKDTLWGDNGSLVIITPKDYFDENGYAYDQHAEIEHLLPNNCFSEQECIWSSEMNTEELEQLLLDRGFCQNIKFTQLCERSFS